MPSDEAQKIINRAVGRNPATAATLIEAEDKEVLLEVIAMSRQHGNAADGVVRAIEAELQGRNVAAQMNALQLTAANQIGALRDVEKATRDQIKVMVRLERKATQLELVLIGLAVLTIVVMVVLAK